MHRLKFLLLPHYENGWVARNKYHLTLKGLRELETLEDFSSLVHDWESIMAMTNLRSISAKVFENGSLLAVINTIITNQSNLRVFNLEINIGCQLEATEKGTMILKSVFSCQTLFQFIIHVPIKKLQLEECVAEIRTSRLISLILHEYEIEDDPMHILGKFHFLEKLCLMRRAFAGEELKCRAPGFPRLKIIELEHLPNLREWIIEKGAMPLLTSIQLVNCPRQEMIPDGLRFTRKLQELKIFEMPELGKRVDAEVGEDFDKIRHVPSIIIG